MKSIMYIGMDVHKDSYNLCSYDPIIGSFNDEIRVSSDYRNIVNYINRLDHKYHGRYEFMCCYEAGGLGYSLYHQLTSCDIQCVIISPSSISRSPKEKKRKTDRLDAQLLAKGLALRSFKHVHVPNDKDNDTKEFIRMRTFYKDQAKRNKQAINAFLLRQGIHYDTGTKWTLAHIKWLRSLSFRDDLQKVFDEYMHMYEYYEENLKRLDQEIIEMSNHEPYAEKTAALKCFKGISDITALSILVEISDFNRFKNASSVPYYLGMTPGLHDSSDHSSHMHITKQGNARVRTLLVEAAQNLVKGTPGKKSKKVRAKQQGQDIKVIAYVDRAVERLQRKYHTMIKRGVKHSIAVMAVARELACFIWGVETGHIEGRITE